MRREGRNRGFKERGETIVALADDESCTSEIFPALMDTERKNYVSNSRRVRTNTKGLLSLKGDPL